VPLECICIVRMSIFREALGSGMGDKMKFGVYGFTDTKDEKWRLFLFYFGFVVIALHTGNDTRFVLLSTFISNKNS